MSFWKNHYPNETNPTFLSPKFKSVSSKNPTKLFAEEASAAPEQKLATIFTSFTNAMIG